MPFYRNVISFSALILNGSSAMRLGSAADKKLKDNVVNANKNIRAK
jgi:hypothetical protein